MEPVDERGILVLKEDGFLEIQGVVSGTTFFHTDNHNFPGSYQTNVQYIYAPDKQNLVSGFCLPDSKTMMYELMYENGGWFVYPCDIWDYPAVESIEILSAPTTVDICKIRGSNFNPTEDAPFCEVIWKDENGQAFDMELVEMMLLYANDTILCMKTAYWEDETAGEETDWGTGIQLVMKEECPNKYYFYAEESVLVEPGEYTFLFCSEYCEDFD